MLVPAVSFPSLQLTPEVTGEAVGIPPDRRRPSRPAVTAADRRTTVLQGQGSDRVDHAVVDDPRRRQLHERAGGRGSTFPRHWVYNDRGLRRGKSAVIDFKEWYHHAHGSHSPWGNEDHAVPTAAAETPLERRLSTIIMRHGDPKNCPSPPTARPSRGGPGGPHRAPTLGSFSSGWGGGGGGPGPPRAALGGGPAPGVRGPPPQCQRRSDFAWSSGSPGTPAGARFCLPAAAPAPPRRRGCLLVLILPRTAIVRSRMTREITNVGHRRGAHRRRRPGRGLDR